MSNLNFHLEPAEEAPPAFLPQQDPSAVMSRYQWNTRLTPARSSSWSPPASPQNRGHDASWSPQSSSYMERQPPSPPQMPTTVVQPMPVVSPRHIPSSNCVAMDCEMVGVGPMKRSVLARVTLVDYDGQTLFDKFVKVEEKVTDYRFSVSGINPEDLQSDKAISFGKCRRQVMMLLQGRVLVGHGLENDLRVLNIGHPWHLTRDTSLYTTFMRVDHQGHFHPGSLRYLARRFLSRGIQQYTHCSVEDATTAMDLYKLVKTEWDNTVYMAMCRSGMYQGGKCMSCFCPPPTTPVHPTPMVTPPSTTRGYHKANHQYSHSSDSASSLPYPSTPLPSPRFQAE